MGCTGNIKWCFMYTNRSSCISFNSLQYCYLILHLIDVGRNWQLVGPGWLLPTLWWTVNLQGCHQDKTLTTVPITQGLRFNTALQIGEANDLKMLSFKGEIVSCLWGGLVPPDSQTIVVHFVSLLQRMAGRFAGDILSKAKPFCWNFNFRWHDPSYNKGYNISWDLSHC